jgi:hypothetical protein
MRTTQRLTPLLAPIAVAAAGFRRRLSAPYRDPKAIALGSSWDEDLVRSHWMMKERSHA